MFDVYTVHRSGPRRPVVTYAPWRLAWFAIRNSKRTRLVIAEDLESAEQ